MDSDDIMLPYRIQKQIKFMKINKNATICGTQVHCFRQNINNIVSTTKHAEVLSFEEYKKKPLHWFLNHPSLCYRKSAILSIGNFDTSRKRMVEDFEMILRMLKKFEYVYNLPEPLLYYRLHENQLTNNGGLEGREYWHNIRMDIISNILKD
jgi:hypothetical protein